MNEKKRIEWDNLEILCIVRFILHRLWMIVLAALIGAMGVYLMQRLLITPSYSSVTTFAVTSRNLSASSTGSISVTGSVAGQFAALLKSSIVQNAAAQRMELSEFPAEVSIYVPENTNILQMEVTAASPALAYQSAIAIIDCYGDYSQNIFSSATLNSINGPSIPTVPVNAGGRDRLLKLSAPLGALVMTALLVVLAVQADTVQTVSGARHQIDGKLLVSVYHERRRQRLRKRLKRQKKALLITNPTCSFYYTETIHQLRVILERDHKKNQHRTFVVTSCSENEGKSTIAANLALSLAQKHPKVLLLDADLRKPAQSLIFEAKVSRGEELSTLLTKGFLEETLRQSIVYNQATGLYTLYAQPLHRNLAERLSVASIGTLLETLRREFSYIIIDTPPIGFFADAQVIADAADASLLVVQQALMPAIAINDAIDELNETRSAFLGVVLNNIRSLRVLSGRHNRYGYGYGYGYGRDPRKERSSDE